MDIPALVRAQRTWFQTGATLPAEARQAALDKLRRALLSWEDRIDAALASDLNKSPAESYLCEVGMTLAELRAVRRHLAQWMRPQGRLTPLAQFPGKSFTLAEPRGVVLILSPWNYPFLLSLEPLVGALAAGNCCILKPSEHAPASSAVLRELLASCFPPELVCVAEGGPEVSRALLAEKFDYIFFTGGAQVGRQVMAAAAAHLTPVTLELGGKSPCVVDATARLDLAAKRLVFGKLLNCGQTCVAPDYVLADRRIKDELIARIRRWMAALYGTDPLDNRGYVRMVNRRHFDRVMGLIDPDKVVCGGTGDPETLKIQPTILDGVSPDDPVMEEEIFGPLLPVLTFDRLQEAADFINRRPHPLALYLFSQDRAARRLFLERVPFGGGCINDTVIHLASSRLPFGGVGDSGMGSYHGRASFDTFSHRKSVVVKGTWFDPPFRYPSYTPWKETLIRLFLR